jgi:hypothetical protein
LLLPTVKKPDNLFYLVFSFFIQPVFFKVVQKEAQPLCSCQHGFAYFIETGEVFVLPVLQERPYPESTEWAIDQIDVLRLIPANQNITPF